MRDLNHVKALMDRYGVEEPQTMIQLGLDILVYALNEVAGNDTEGVLSGTMPGDVPYIFAVGEVAKKLQSGAIEEKYDEHMKL